MKNTSHSPFVLNDTEILKMLNGFCSEALKFLGVSKNMYPKFKIGLAIGKDNKAIPIVIDYSHSIILVCIPFFKLLVNFNSNNSGESPTLYRMMGYQLARFWDRYIKHKIEDAFNSMDTDSIVFASSLMTLKGMRTTPITPIPHVIEMLKKEFHLECECVTGYDPSNGLTQKVIRYTKSEQEKQSNHWKELIETNISRPLEHIFEGQLGSATNPFPNVDEASAFILNIEKERLDSDPYRKAVYEEQYFYDGNIFRIPWASANVAYYPIEEKQENIFIVSQLSTHNKFVLKPSLAHRKFLFRGQSKFYSPCKPGLFRIQKDYYVDDIIYINELECLLKTHPLVRLFENGFELFHDQFKFKINYSGLAQHYYNKTAFLDLTSDMEVAKFFAVTTFNYLADRYEKYNGNELGVLYYFDLKADSFCTSIERNYIIDNIGKQPFMRSGNQSGFLISLNKEDDFNTLPEVRYVFFRHDQVVTDRIFAQFKKGDLIMPEEILRRHWYSKMQSDDNKIISYDVLKLNYGYNPKDSHNKIIKALKDKGFKLKNYHPTFTDEELELYYSAALGEWENFCANIYFYIPEGSLLKEHLRNLPNDPRYKWAFIR